MVESSVTLVGVTRLLIFIRAIRLAGVFRFIWHVEGLLSRLAQLLLWHIKFVGLLGKVR
jgi:hypothetical protein